MTALQSSMEALRLRFIARAGDDLLQLRTQAQKGAMTAEDLRALVHRLAGSAGLFGYPAISVLASAVEDDVIETGMSASLPDLMLALENVIAKASHRPPAG
ncbi:MAG TPA: Hpt domain-containing protein [Rhizomicrobium sp.]|jgi:HPt (histidine-containing phosphotransfer) domain-containing protein